MARNHIRYYLCRSDAMEIKSAEDNPMIYLREALAFSVAIR